MPQGQRGEKQELLFPDWHLENWKKKILLAESNISNPGMYKAHAPYFWPNLAMLYAPLPKEKRQGITAMAAAPCPKPRDVIAGRLSVELLHLSCRSHSDSGDRQDNLPNMNVTYLFNMD